MQHYPAIKTVCPGYLLVSRRRLRGRIRCEPGQHRRSPALASTTRTHHKKSGISAYGDPTKNDNADFDDPVIRQVAVDALGHANGSVLAMDPSTGRILTIVNQKMAFLFRLRTVLDDQAGDRACWTAKKASSRATP